jgi:hypothetical protein
MRRHGVLCKVEFKCQIFIYKSSYKGPEDMLACLHLSLIYIVVVAAI